MASSCAISNPVNNPIIMNEIDLNLMIFRIFALLFGCYKSF